MKTIPEEMQKILKQALKDKGASIDSVQTELIRAVMEAAYEAGKLVGDMEARQEFIRDHAKWKADQIKVAKRHKITSV